jgi:hypothetical protein
MKSIHRKLNNEYQSTSSLLVEPLNSIYKQVSVDIRIKAIKEIRNPIFFIESRITNELQRGLADLNEIIT